MSATEVEILVAGQKKAIETGLFINNQFVKAKSGKKFPTVNPATGEVICEVEEAGKEDVQAAVKAAQDAFDNVWSKTPAAERGKMLWKLGELVDQNAQDLANLEALDMGKTAAMAGAMDVPGLASCLRYYAGFADKIHGKVMMDEPNFFNYTRHEPYGVCGAIIPWNFPLLMLAWKVGPALACGNTLVLKSSEKTPLSALAFAKLCQQVLPPGVLNVVSGYGPTTGQAIIEEPSIYKVAFTGSARTGRLLLQGASKTNLKKVSLELGGKSPAIVFDDCDIDQAVQWCHMGIFFNHGQVCCASSRVYVHEGIKDKFLEKYTAAAQAIKVGDQFDPATNQGPQVDEIQFNSIMKYIETGKSEGKLVTGGKRHGDKGFFIEPTIFTDVPDSAKIMREEIFGPVVAVNTFKDEAEIIKRANDTTYGLAAAVFTKDLNRAIRVSNALQAGTVWVNCYNIIQNSTPFGGYKESGQGRELGEYALELWTQVKSVKINLA
ncbi:putative Iad1-indole-3-acetaldehyde dehydrogenase [Hyaloraphidium curvatum]|nr:putative Iad1-indole-3-acetaldehyde dehydrogenase [Hyaloraphidium curvatum]